MSHAKLSKHTPWRAGFAGIAGLLAVQSGAGAATLTVSSNLDSGAGCTLRNAIASVNTQANVAGCVASGAYNTGDRIDVTSTGVIPLDSANGSLVITRDVQLVGPGATQLTIACPANSTFTGLLIGQTWSMTNVSVQALTVSGCSEGAVSATFCPSLLSSGGGVTICAANSTMNVQLTDMVLSGNSANSGGGLKVMEAGGTVSVVRSSITNNTAQSCSAIDSFNSTTAIVDSTISGNSVTTGSSAICNLDTSILTLTNSTVSGNAGGGIEVDSSDTTIEHSTIVNNGPSPQTPSNGGIGVLIVAGPFTSGAPVIRNTIIAGHSVSDIWQDPSVTIAGGWQTNYNVIQNPDVGVTMTGTGNVTGGSVPLLANWLGPLANNGGPTLTHALLTVIPGNPALDSGDPNAAGYPSYEQRGTPFARVRNGRVDIGAFEAAIGATLGAVSAIPVFGPGAFALLTGFLGLFGLRRLRRR